MTTYNTGNAVPSTNPKDLYDNAQALDEAVNSTAATFTDRLGNERTTLFRSVELGMASVGIYPDQASGVAAVGEGGYFCVPAALDSEWLVLYRVEGGTYVEKKRLPSVVRIDEIQGRVDTAESNITALDGRLDTAESDINAVEGRATTLEGRATALEGRATALEGRATSAESNIAALDVRMDDAESDVSALSGQTATAVTDIQSLKLRASSLETRATEAEGDINSLEGRLDDMAGLVAAAGTAAESAEQSASEALAKATEAAEDAAAAQASAQAAQDAADSAVAVVTGGTASLTPEPGKIPIADGSGRIDGDWAKFQQLGAGATQRTALAKLLDLAASVLDFGAIGDGVSDDTDAFSRAAKEAPALDLFIPAYQDIPSASTCVVSVPAGEYVLSAPVDVGGRDVIWELQAGARIEGYEFLEGRLSRPGLRASAGRHFGILDHACSFTIRGNRDVERGPGVLGITHPNQLSVYGDRDSVSLYVDNEGPPAIVVAGASYSATTLICPTPVDVKTLRKGMIIDTAHTPNKYSGLITGWAADGSTVSVSAWYEVTGATGVEVTPPNGVDAYINPMTKVWALNAQVVLTANSHANGAAGFELGVRNSKRQITSPGDSNPVWGGDIVMFGPYNGSVGYMQRGPFLRGFESSGAIFDGFSVTSRNNVTPVTGLAVRCASPEQIACKPDGTNNIFSVSAGGTVLQGSAVAAGNVITRYRSSALNTEYDARIFVSGGAENPGQGTMRLQAGFIELQAITRPFVDNAHPLGQSSYRFTTIFATTGTINTSDERAKQQISAIPDAVLDAWSAVDYALFKYNDAVELKGPDGARWHFGVIAQRVKEAFEAKGLDPFSYGLLCYDEWDEQPEIASEWEDEYVDIIVKQAVTVTHPATEAAEEWVETLEPAITEPQLVRPAGREVVQPYRPAGNRFGIRYEEALVLEAALMRRTTRRLEDRLAALESATS